MLDPQEFITSLDDHGISFYAGVPCSFLKEPMSILASRPNYVGAAIETDAAALCAGAWLAGQKTAVFCQNSGLGNLISPLSSLNAPFAIPTLLVIGWRGKPGEQDEPQHMLMGSVTHQMLAQMGVQAFQLPKTNDAAKQVLDQAIAVLEGEGKSVALLVRPNTFGANAKLLNSTNLISRDKNDKIPVKELKTGTKIPSRFELLTAIVDATQQDAAVIATTGKCGRELYAIHDKKQHFYMVGSMGSASAIGLGVALNSERPVMVLDGDGAALMRLGTMATIGRVHPRNLVHVILDNEAHDSTGGQPTGSGDVDFPAIAAACGYASATSCDNIETAVQALAACLATSGPHLLHIRIKPGSMAGLGRPQMHPSEVAIRFRNFLDSPL